MKKSEKISLAVLWTIFTVETLIYISAVIYIFIMFIKWLIDTLVYERHSYFGVISLSSALISLVIFSASIYIIVLQVKCVISIAKNKFVDGNCDFKLNKILVITIIKLVLSFCLIEVLFYLMLFVFVFMIYYILLAIVCKLLKMDRFYQ